MTYLETVVRKICIQGTWDNYRQAKRIYARLGYPERVDLVEVQGKHGVQPQNLATIAHWMKRWLLGRDEAVPLVELSTRPASELVCTEPGQVLKLPGERSVFDLNAEYEAELAQKPKQLWKTTPRDEMVSRIRELLGVRPNSELKPPKWQDLGRAERDEYHIDKLVLRSDSRVPLPALTFHPPSPVDEAYLYLHDDGKLGDTGAGGAIKQLVEDGYAVVTVDLRGQGEKKGSLPFLAK